MGGSSKFVRRLIRGAARGCGRGATVYVLAATILFLCGYGTLLWQLEPSEFQVSFPPAPPAPEGWTPLFQPFECARVEPVEAATEQFDPRTPILAVTVGGKSRAYPLTVIGGRAAQKVVNDSLGGEAIAVTF